MRGAVAAGHPLTAEAGARVLEAGGNAVDACVAAACVSWVCESPLTGPGGGGFMLVHQGSDGKSRLFDFFVTVPRSPADTGELLQLAIDFDGDTQQVFHTGAGAVAVPGTALGLEAAHRRFGTVPWAELGRPGGAPRARGRRADAAAGLSASHPRRAAPPLAGGERDVRTSRRGRAAAARASGSSCGDFADTLERIAEGGAGVLYGGDLARRIVDHVQVGRRRADARRSRGLPRRAAAAAGVEYRGHEFRSNPPPSSGGLLVGLGLRSLGDDEPDAEAIVAAMEAQDAVRGGAFVRGLQRGGAAQRLLSGTTHISVVDARGDAASLSASLGSGSGVVVPGTGIHLNNMLGEADLAADARPGERLTSMMAPSVVLQEGRPRLVVGSAGSARLRGAILQVVANVVGKGMVVEEAVDAPRLHAEDGVVYCEDAAVADRLEAAGREVVRFRRQNLFFGGVSAVEVLGGGRLAAAGDPRRGGAGVVVP